VADDAGVITILFCDICDFDEVIKECQDSIVEVLDEIFRAFDSFCQVHGIQKIETVGKTYMAAAGLKFVENDLPDHLKKINPTQRLIELCRKMNKFIEGYTYQNGKKLVIKIGVHKG
jgi:class 3 adenylate cyclase